MQNTNETLATANTFKAGQTVIVLGKIEGTYHGAPWGDNGFHVVTTKKGGQLHVSKSQIAPK